MPEGPEVFFLCRALLAYGAAVAVPAGVDAEWPDHINCKGKHLLLEWQHGRQEDWSFAMTGKVAVDGVSLRKVAAGYLPGQVMTGHRIVEKLGVDWMTADPVRLLAVVRDTFRLSRASLGSLLLKQECICGIGVAWGSEILAESGVELRPELPACNQDLGDLVPAMMRVRARVLHLYVEQMLLAEAGDDPEKLRALINGWFDNLYARREMRVYKRGQAVKVGQRTWWVLL